MIEISIYFLLGLILFINGAGNISSYFDTPEVPRDTKNVIQVIAGLFFLAVASSKLFMTLDWLY